jgi:hypothetical protein
MFGIDDWLIFLARQFGLLLVGTLKVIEVLEE